MKRVAPFLVTGICLVAAIACGIRIVQVNSSYPSQHYYSYAIGERATYAGQNSSGEEVTEGNIQITAQNFELLSYDQLRQLVVGYSDEVINAGGATDMKSLLVKITIKNPSDKNQKVHVRDFKLESGALANGLAAPLYESLNENPATIFTVNAGEEVERTLVYQIYDSFTSGSAEWNAVDNKAYNLVLALYPNKYSINLGRPHTNDQERDSI